MGGGGAMEGCLGGDECEIGVATTMMKSIDGLRG